ncbi:ABC transporter ATP-binding protein [Gorillibacterium timonense]|uniref:ABC transporter ATP-binding protein n=1 Tax=Gorillibacterium timonense TaxID=1689269 RepID=UPI000ACCC9D1|nr:ABC transporter ATP-binding protein [Gorillibacterium timonense]
MSNLTESSPQPAIQVEGVTKSFGKKEVLRGIHLAIKQAEIFGLLGPSGSGKTTLVRMMTGIDTATTGEIHLLGERMPKLSMFKNIGYMAQSDALYMELSGKENLEFFASLFGMSGSVRRRRIEEVMELVNLTADLNKPAAAYSGGMRRRLSLAIALIHRPAVLILDEPTVGIDPVLRQSIWQELHALKKSGTTIVVTTHVMDEADKCDRLAMIRDGSLIAMGSSQELMESSGTTTIEEAFLHYGGAAV